MVVNRKSVSASCLAMCLLALMNWAPRISAQALPPPFNITDVSPTKGNFLDPAVNHSPSGKMLSLAVSNDGERLYVGGYSGVWRSDNHGVDWHQLTRPQPLPGDLVPGALMGHTVFDVVVSPVNRDLVFAATSRDTHATPQNGIYQSNDGGDSWTLAHQFFCAGPAGGGTQVGQIVFAPDNPDLLFAAGGCAIARRRNGIWEDKALPGVWHVAVAPRQGVARRVYAAGNSQFWYSDNEGDTWSRDTSSGLPGSFGGVPCDGAQCNSSQVLAVEPGHP